jgi:hypothetical protein
VTAPAQAGPAQGASARLAAIVGDERDSLAARLAGARTWALAAATVAVLALGIALLGGGRWFTLWRWLPLAWWGLATGAGLLAWRTLRRRAPVPDATTVARAIEEARTLRTGELRVALEGDDLGAFGAAAAQRTLAKLDAAPARGPLAPALLAAADAQRARWQRLALGAAATALVATAIWPDGLRALALPLAAARGTLLPAMRIEAPRAVLAGARPVVRVRAPQRTRVTLVATALVRGERAPRRLALPVRDGVASVTLPPLARGVVTLQADDGRATTGGVVIRVADLPYLGDVTAEAEYPAYLGRATEPVPLAGVLVVPRGTVLRIAAHGSVPVRDVALRADGGELVPLAASGEFDARGALVATRSTRYTWQATGSIPLQQLPASFALDVRPDSAPIVEVASTSDTLLAGSDALALEVRAADDHRLASVALEVRADGVVRARRALLTEPTSSLAVQVPLDLGALGVADAGTVTVQAVAVDASPWRQVGRSRVLVVRRATVTERRAAARAAADSVASAAAALAKQQASLAQKTGDAARSAARRQGDSSSMGFDARERAQALAEQQRALQQQAQQLQQQAKALQEALRSAGALDSSLAGKLADAQRLMQQAISPAMMQKLQQLEQGAQRLDPQATRQSLDDLAKQQQALREQLERNAEMLKRAALEGSMETLRDEAQELAQRQRAQADSAGRGRASREEGQRLAQRSEQLARDVEQLGKRLRQADAQQGARRADAARDQARRSAEAMQRAGQDAQAADRAAQAMEDAAKELAEAREEQVDAWKKETTGEIDQAVNELMQLGEQERRMAESAQREGVDREMAGQQASLQAGAQAAAERLREAARRSQHVSPGSQRAMQEALQKLSEATRAAQRGATPPPNERAQEPRSSTDTPQGRMPQGGAPQGGAPQPGGQSQGTSQGAQGTPGGEQGRQGATSQQGTQSPSAGQQGSTPGSSGSRAGSEAANAMRDAAQALDRAASSLVRDRERANRARSASGMPEMLEELAQAAKQQQSINGQAGAMSMMPGGESGAQAQSLAQALARKQRQMAQRLDDVSGTDGSGRAEALAQEARRLAEAMERAASDPETARRREEFYQRLLSAGRTLRRDDVDDQQPRESKPGIGAATYLPPAGSARGAPATPIAAPTWEALRGLREDERRAVLEYFERLNRQAPAVKP